MCIAEYCQKRTFWEVSHERYSGCGTNRRQHAFSNDGIKWERKGDIVGIDVSEEGWDSVMITYAHVYEHIYRSEKPSKNSYLCDIIMAVTDFGYRPKYSYIEILQDMKRRMSGHRFDHLADADITV